MVVPYKKNVEATDLDIPVWGAPKIAKIVNVSTEQAYYMLERGYLPARKIGKQWVSTKRELLEKVIGRV